MHQQCVHACIPHTVSQLMLSCRSCFLASCTAEKLCANTEDHLFFIVAANEMWNNWQPRLKGQISRKKNDSSFLQSFLLSKFPSSFISTSRSCAASLLKNTLISTYKTYSKSLSDFEQKVITNRSSRSFEINN